MSLFSNKKVAGIVVDEIFRFSLLAFIIIFAVELIEPGFFTNWFNPIWVLIVCMLSSIISIAKK